MPIMIMMIFEIGQSLEFFLILLQLFHFIVGVLTIISVSICLLELRHWRRQFGSFLEVRKRNLSPKRQLYISLISTMFVAVKERTPSFHFCHYYFEILKKRFFLRMYRV